MLYITVETDSSLRPSIEKTLRHALREGILARGISSQIEILNTRFGHQEVAAAVSKASMYGTLNVLNARGEEEVFRAARRDSGQFQISCGTSALKNQATDILYACIGCAATHRVHANFNRESIIEELIGTGKALAQMAISVRTLAVDETIASSEAKLQETTEKLQALQSDRERAVGADAVPAMEGARDSTTTARDKLKKTAYTVYAASAIIAVVGIAIAVFGLTGDTNSDMAVLTLQRIGVIIVFLYASRVAAKIAGDHFREFIRMTRLASRMDVTLGYIKGYAAELNHEAASDLLDKWVMKDPDVDSDR